MVNNKQQTGFTIVELLIVIVVIGILAAITIVAYSGIQDRARATQTNAGLNDILKAVHLARINEGKTLMQITGTGCTSCTDPDGTKMATALDKIGVAAGMSLSGLKKGDGWGDPYKLDENEGEQQFVDPCRADTFSLTNQTIKVGKGVIVPKIPTYGC